MHNVYQARIFSFGETFYLFVGREGGKEGGGGGGGGKLSMGIYLTGSLCIEILENRLCRLLN